MQTSSASVTRLHLLHTEHGQSPWLDDLRRSSLLDGGLRRLVEEGIRGVTSNPTTFQRAITGSTDYDAQFGSLVRSGLGVDEAYWVMVVQDVTAALDLLRPVFDASGGVDGFVSVELGPDLAHDADGSVAAASALHERIGAPNLYVKVPATPAGVQAFRRLVAQGHSTNVTLIFGLARYEQVVEAYLGGLEELAARDPQADLSSVASVASFFLSRVDSEVDRRLGQLDDAGAAPLAGLAGIAQAKLAHQLFRQRFSGPRWEALAARGARVQRPLWASTSTKDPAQPDTRYIDELIGPDTVTTIPPATIAAFQDHGTLSRSVDRGVEEALDVVRRLGWLGVDLAEVSAALEEQGIASFSASSRSLARALAAKADALREAGGAGGAGEAGTSARRAG